MAPNLTGDSGVASVPTARATVFASGMPASPSTDYANGDTATVQRPDVCNPTLPGMTNPPSATTDAGSN